jgi:FkbH-like protein
MLDWLPPPHDFQPLLREAMRADSLAVRKERLLALCQFRLDFLQTIQVKRAIDQFIAQAGEALQPHRLAIAASATTDHLAPGIVIAALRRGVWMDVQVGGYGQYRQEIMDPQSSLHRFAPQTVLFSLHAAPLLPEVNLEASRTQVDELLGGIIDELTMLWRRVQSELGANVLQQSLLNVTEPLFGAFERLIPAAPWNVVERFNELLAAAIASERVAIIDVARAAQRDGLDAWFDAPRMLQAKQEIAPQAASLYGELVARVVCAQQGKSKKCLVLDLDNTLWGGVVGDDGVKGLVLGQGSAAGEAHLGVQRYAKQLKERGIILAVCSKNDMRIAEDAFANHPEMILQRADIASFVANWEDKARNLETIAKELNIGIDSLVFLDDNPAERARVREALPAVGVPELPDDVSGYVRRLADAGYFEATSFTKEDRERSGLYAQIAERNSLQASAQSMDEFLLGLKMVVEYGPVTAVDLPRVAQLINKTNQFTPTTRRYSEERVAALLGTPGVIGLQFRLKDRFGDNGLVSALLMLPSGAHRLEIDTWVMSCRVFGRQLEHEVMNIAVESARRSGISEITATYSPTPKNELIRDLYPNFGFRSAGPPAQPAETSRWSLRVADYSPASTHITREARPS